MAPIITSEGLTKWYGRSRGIENVSFTVNEGEIFGFLGPNGAGKTTTIRLLMGLLRPTGGSASIGGHDTWTDSVAVKRLVGYLPSDPQLDSDLTGGQLIEYFTNLRGGVDKKYVQSLVDRFELDTRKRFRDYSRGNKQKVGIVQAFMHKPKLLVLDEASSGLDPLNQIEFNKLLMETRTDGRTVFLSSHILPEVEQVCDRVAVLNRGVLVALDSPLALRQMHAERKVDAVLAGGSRCVFDLDRPEERARLGQHVQAGDVVSVQTREFTFHQAFLKLTGAPLNDDAPGAAAERVQPRHWLSRWFGRRSA